MAQTLGILDVTWQGRNLAVDKGAKFKLGGLKKTALIAGRQVHYANEFEASEITATIPLPRGQRLLDLYPTGTGELQIVCDTGQTYVFADAFLTNRPEATAGEGGKIELVWSAGEAEELLNG